MKIKIYTMYFLPEFGSAPILMNELASYLSSRGHDVEVVTTIPRPPHDVAYRGRIRVRESGDGFGVKRYLTNFTQHHVGRLIAWSIYTLWTFWSLKTVRKNDVLFLRLPPLQLGVTGVLAKKWKGAGVLLNVQDIHPDLSIESGLLKNPFLTQLARRFERWIYSNHEDIVVISEGFKKNLEDKNVSPEKIKVIPNWVDTDFLKPLPKDNPVSQKYSLTRKFVIMYSGTISISSILSLKKVLESAKLLEDDKDILFVIVGEGLKKQDLTGQAEKTGLRNVRFLPFQPYEDLPHLLASSDLLLVPLDREKSHLSVPSKLYNFMATGRAILGLADDSSEVAGIIGQTGCGLCSSPDDPEKIAETVRKVKASLNGRKNMGANARRYALENFSKERVLRKYEELILSLS